MKETVKLVALDLDDTLLTDDLTISDYTVSVLQRVMDSGIYIVLASGRSPRGMYPYIQRIGSDARHSFMVCSNGAQILTSDTMQEVRSHVLDASLAQEIFDSIEQHNLSCHLYVDDAIYVSKNTLFSEQDSHLTKMRLVIPENYRRILNTLPVYKMVIPGTPEHIAAVEPLFKASLAGRATVFTSKPYFLEVVPLHSGKGEALLDIAEILGLDSGAIMAFGDSMNDESMIRLAAFGIAMKNGLPVIKQAAYSVTDFTNNEDGAAHFLEKYVL
ncbi:MAG: Cof-type HAD-IIB family hydrolase [Treponema sp.]